MKRLLIGVAMGLLAVCVSCNKAEWEARKNPYRSLNLTTKSAGFVSAGNASFTFDFIDRVNAAAETRFIVSPLSLQILLGMALDGAQGETAAQICQVLGYGVGETDAVNAYALELLRQLPSLDKRTKLLIGNALFADQGFPLLDTYQRNLKQYYLAEVENLDFSDGPGTLKRINGWCSDHTGKMIPKVLDRVDPSVVAYLLNAMYFKSQWKEKFEKKSTGEEDFYPEGDSDDVSIIPMMKQVKKFDYIENDVFQAVRLPYGNGAFSMFVLLPRSGHTVSEITSALKGMDWDTFRHQMQRHEVDLWLPKFETKYHIDLKKMLSAMGMPDTFDPVLADFGAMASPSPYVSAVTQDAIIKVDEEGTEAAVVSKMHFAKTSDAGCPSAVFHANHPFLYLIAETYTGAVLFAGRYN